MQSVIQKKSYNSVTVFWLDKGLLLERISAAVRSLSAERPEIEKVILFGSVADQRETPSSDADILIVASDCPYRFLDRAQAFSKYFEGIGLGVDLFVYTRKEIDRGIHLADTAFKKGKILFERR